MKIKGGYRDVLSRNGEVIADTGWKFNEIVEDYGRFLAALMKKDFNGEVGIDYMAVGSGSEDYAEFKSRVESFFDSKKPEQLPEPSSEEKWVWAKEIDAGNIIYLDENDKEVDDPNKITKKLKITVTFREKEPSEATLVFKEFALLGIDKEDGKFDTRKMFFINYAGHGPITKDKSMELTRTIKLTFPIEEKAEGAS